MALDDFIDVEIETNPDELVAEALQYLTDNIPGYVAAPANLETWIIEAVARIASEIRDILGQVPKSIFRQYGADVIGIEPIDAAAASATGVLTMVNTNGYTVDEGTVFTMRGADGQPVAFVTIEEYVIPNGNDTVPVSIVAVLPGEDGNLLDDPVLADTNPYIDSLVLDAPTSGGVDAEDDDTYLDRLSAELRLLSPRPILARDFAVLARRIAGVSRATAIDGYEPSGPSYGNDRTVSVAAIDEDGQPVSGAIKTAIDDLLQSLREVNFLVYVIDPEYTDISVDFDAVAYGGWDIADVEARAIEAVTDYLSPANWGLGEAGSGETREWINSDTVRYLEVAEAIQRVDGLDYITALTVNAGTADVTLSGAASLPQPDVITGDVVAP